MEDYSCFVMTNCGGFHWNMVRLIISFLECLICYLLFVVVVVSAWVIWPWTLANNGFSAAVIQASQHFSLLWKAVWMTTNFLWCLIIAVSSEFWQDLWVHSLFVWYSLCCLLMLFTDVFGFELRPMTGLALPWSKVYKRVSLFLCKWVWKTILLSWWPAVAVSIEIL